MKTVKGPKQVSV